MNNISKVTLFFIILNLTCCGDPPLLRTPLPNGYALDSNGGNYGYLKTPDGKRMSEYFGMLNNDIEVWCREFAWQDDFVICKMYETSKSDNYQKEAIHYFVVDTSTSKITRFWSEGKVSQFWKNKFGNPIPEMKSKHLKTRKK